MEYEKEEIIYKSLFLIYVIVLSIGCCVSLVLESLIAFICILVIISICFIITFYMYKLTKKQKVQIVEEILKCLNISRSEIFMDNYDDVVYVRSRQSYDNYSYIKYLKENRNLNVIQRKIEKRQKNQQKITKFLKDNIYKDRKYYWYMDNILRKYIKRGVVYCVKISYTTPAATKHYARNININSRIMQEFIEHPEYLMTKGEYSRFIKNQTNEELEREKKSLYDQVNNIIDYANQCKNYLVIKSKAIEIDNLIDRLFNKTVNGIQRISRLDSEAWEMFRNLISETNSKIRDIVSYDRQISNYYKSEEFQKIKHTCNLLTVSQREFNEYINEKAESISKLFGTRVVRNETENQDTYNYLRPYKKNINPFVAEVSSAVFGSAENDPIGYIIKYFYPNRSEYPEQISKLKVLISEIETLKDAKTIIDNYKRDYDEYIKEVPNYVLENDEAGFYSRLGLAIIDEAVLNVEYKFVYTSDGSMAQRSFTVPMNEENVAELIKELENKLTLRELAKEQRSMMTVKLRNHIKERDNYTCCCCGNSIYKEPNLLLEIDHVIPIAKGGLTKEDNLQTLCWKCNRNKGSKII